MRHIFPFRWVREFLNEENLGLDVLIDYLSFRLLMMRHEQRINESRNASEERLSGSTNTNGQTGHQNNLVHHEKQNGYLRPPLEIIDSPGIKRRSKHVAKLNMGEAKDDIHVCIMCMRAIMNNKVNNTTKYHSSNQDINISYHDNTLRYFVTYVMPYVMSILVTLCYTTLSFMLSVSFTL